MKKTILAGIFGGLVLFVWGFLSWAALGLHDGTMRSIPNEDAVAALLKQNLTEKSMYMFPGRPQGKSDAEMKIFEEKFKAGPMVFMSYDPAGGDMMMMKQMVIGLLIVIFCAWLAAWILSRSTAIAESYFSRVTFVAVLGLLGTTYHDLINWNWMGFPFDYTLVAVADSIFTWFLAGLVIARIVKMKSVS
jgi:hypothetical protein